MDERQPCKADWGRDLRARARILCKLANAVAGGGHGEVGSTAGWIEKVKKTTTKRKMDENFSHKRPVPIIEVDLTGLDFFDRRSSDALQISGQGSRSRISSAKKLIRKATKIGLKRESNP